MGGGCVRHDSAVADVGDACGAGAPGLAFSINVGVFNQGHAAAPVADALLVMCTLLLVAGPA